MCFTVVSHTRKHVNSIHRVFQDVHGSWEPAFSAPLQHCLDLGQEKAASNWLTALPIEDYGFALHKSGFWDVLALRYMAGYFKTFLPPVPVATSCQLSMLYHALWVDFQLYVTMK